MKILLCGATGRMGKQVIQLLLSTYRDYDIAASVSSVTTDEQLDAGAANADVVIDFSLPTATPRILQAATKYRLPYLLCVTGYSNNMLAQLKEVGKVLPLLYAPNTSIGANLVGALSAKIAAALADYDAEIIDIHHRHKKDAPSGTAMSIAHSIATARGLTLETYLQKGRSGKSMRKNGEIGISSVRGGNIAGQHDVSFSGDKEVLTISHQALSPDLFADGAIRAATWVKQQKPGFYTMRDMLGF